MNEYEKHITDVKAIMAIKQYEKKTTTRTEEKAVSEGGNKAGDNFAMDTAAIPAQGFQGA